VSCNDVTVGAVAEEAPFAIIKDAPAAPNAGKTILRRFRFETRFACAMVEPFCRCGPIQPYQLSIVTMPRDEVGHMRSRKEISQNVRTHSNHKWFSS